MGGADALGREGLRGEGVLAALGEKRAFEEVEAFLGVARQERGGQRFAAGAVRLAARGEVGEEPADGLAGFEREDGGEQGLDREARVPRRGRGRGLRASKRPAKAARCRAISRRSGSGSSPATERAMAAKPAGSSLGEAVEDVGAERLGLAVVEDAELGRDAGLEREAAEKRLAEGVDRLDLEAARGLERPREEGARVGDLLGRDRLVGVERARGAARRAASSSIAQPPRVAKSRVCISAAAALV